MGEDERKERRSRRPTRTASPKGPRASEAPPEGEPAEPLAPAEAEPRVAPLRPPRPRTKPSARARRSEPAEPAEVPPAAPQPSPRALSARPSRAPREGEGAVLITGICGRLGKLVARALHRVDKVVGIDRRPFPDRPKDVVFHEFDLRRGKTRDVIRTGKVRAVVHLGILHDPRTSDHARHDWNVVAFQKLLEAASQYEVKKLVVLSSANVYGPHSSNSQFLTEDAPLLGSQSFGGMRDLVELDMLAQSHFWRHPECETVVLRPCHIVGSVRNAPSNYLRLARPITLLGFDPMLQLIHERDVVRAILLALQPGAHGIFNLRGPGELPLSRILQRIGKQPHPLPGSVARAAVDRLWQMRLSSFPSPELDHVRYVCMVDDTRARELLGFTPRYGLDETLAAALAGA